MKIRQNVRHWAAKKALTTPVVGEYASDKLVDLHTKIFLGKADEDRREERREHLDAFFDATMDAYVAALEDGYSEAEAREITHIQANFDFFNHGWTEMMEIPADELEEHYRRYDEFFDEYDVTIDDPLGEFRPPTGIPEARPTPEKRDAGEYENAVAGFADDVYVQTPTGVNVGGGEEPEDVTAADAPGMDDQERNADD
jgi:PAS domain-containing protein